MPKATQLSEFERGEIVDLKKANFSYREIARILNRSKSAVEKVAWPAQSPDLNPIENLWQDLKRRLRMRNPKPKNKIELFNLLKEEWFNTIPVRINRLIDSMPQRVDAVLKNKGNPTRY